MVTATSTTQLVLLPHAGADASTFGAWLDKLPPSLSPVLPATPQRPSSIHEAAVAVCAQLPAGRDVALFGHSYGAAVAARAAHLLHDSGRRRVVWVGLSGWSGPPPAGPDATTDDAALVAELRRLGGFDPSLVDDDFHARRLPSIRAQWKALAQPFPALDLGPVPVLWMRGDEDPHVDDDARPVTSDHVSSLVLPGDHFYLFQDATRVIAVIAAAIRDLRQSPVPHHEGVTTS